MKPVMLAAFALLASSAAQAQNIAPSFNCNRASFADERTICDDDRLAQMDQALTIALRQVKPDSIKMAREDAFARLKDRHACGADRMCILDNQVQVLDMIDGYGAHVPTPPWVGAYRLDLIEAGQVPMVADLPKRVGACTRTKIAAIASRFGDTLQPPATPDDDHGTSIDYANEGHGVSYSFVPAVADSKIGDPVIVCLVSLPKDCPPGDDRGKMYSGTNLRTKGSWILPDSQHMCGGA
jgi:uncharacterized protein